MLDLKQYYRQHNSNEKVPATLIFLDDYPMAALGKVKKFRLRVMAQEMFSSRK